MVSTKTMLPKSEPAKHVHRKLAAHIPSFSDFFDEESFYIFAIILTVIAVVAACVASRHVKIKDAGHID